VRNDTLGRRYMSPKYAPELLAKKLADQLTETKAESRDSVEEPIFKDYMRLEQSVSCAGAWDLIHLYVGRQSSNFNGLQHVRTRLQSSGDSRNLIITLIFIFALQIMT